MPRKKKRAKTDPEERLSARSRQVLEILYRLGEATAGEILDVAGDEIPSYSAVRSILRQLVSKGRVMHVAEGQRYVYRPTVPRESQSRAALASVLDTFFEGSAERTMKALIDLSRSSKEDVDLLELERLIRKARREGR